MDHTTHDPNNALKVLEKCYVCKCGLLLLLLFSANTSDLNIANMIVALHVGLGKYEACEKGCKQTSICAHIKIRRKHKKFLHLILLLALSLSLSRTHAHAHNHTKTLLLQQQQQQNKSKQQTYSPIYSNNNKKQKIFFRQLFWCV
eukprot:c6477_g1_i2.p1 GENE.c6477_g1_i2~~c6477_g1_i2.p1  ORF type:complete len:145 (+),score=25.68 c6477_g1_i2:679-1113(+)